MSDSLDKINRRNRDGTSQLARVQPALSPDYVSVDERSLEDLLTFAHAYANELNFYDETNSINGDWREFIVNGENLDTESKLREHIKQAADYARNPEKTPAHKLANFSRPHFALYLGFLRLLGTAQEQLNSFTRRHLDFYYQQILRMTKKAAEPDKVNVMLRLSAQRDEVEVPEGTKLIAGRDSEGHDLYYSTDQRILVNHASIVELKATYAQRQIIGIREAKENYPGTYNDSIINMFEIALGDPLPGEPMPEYEAGKQVDYAVLTGFKPLIDFCKDKLFLDLYDFRSLMRLKEQRNSVTEDWNTINAYLELAGKTRTNNPAYSLITDEPDNFDKNLSTVMGGTPDFKGLTQVENIVDLYHERNRDEVKNYIVNNLYFNDVNDFIAMMQIKVKIDSEWKEINRLLETAGQRKRKDLTYELIPVDDTAFDVNFKESIELGGAEPVDFASQNVANIDEYFSSLLYLEKYFYMSAEDLAYVITVITKPKEQLQDGEWDKVYKILGSAYKNKVYEQRRKKLNEVHKSESDPVLAYRSLLYFVLGKEMPADQSSPLSDLVEYVSLDSDYKLLESIETTIKEGNIGKIDWYRVYRILELAQRHREQLAEPVARIKRWINLTPYSDATQIQTEPDNPRWKTFGQPMEGTDEVPNSVMGWAVGSPALLLSAGERRVTVTLGFDKELYNAEKITELFPKGPVATPGNIGPFDVSVSSGEAWIVPELVEVSHGEYFSLTGLTPSTGQESLSGLQFTLDFSIEIDPITAPVAESGLQCKWPVIKLMLRQIWDDIEKRYVTHYSPFEELELVKVHLKTEVGKTGVTESGLVDVQLQNDLRSLKAKKPFAPFGNRPATGSRFYIGHPELSCKNLNKLSFNVEWMGAPDNFSTYYANYEVDGFDWTFKTKVSLVEKRIVYNLADLELFNPTKASDPQSLNVADVEAAIQRKKPDYQFKLVHGDCKDKDITQWHRYLQWELTPLDFQHQNYRAVNSRLATELRAAIANANAVAIYNTTAVEGKEKPVVEVVAEDYQVNPPYTPAIQRMEVHYSASSEIDLLESVPKQSDDQIFHLHPFGYNEAHPKQTGGCWFLPRYENEGELYIGIADAKPPQSLSVLFQMAEGTANPDHVSSPIEWRYLDGDRWLSMADGGIRQDTTRGLINSGIIEFDLKSVSKNTRLPNDLYWIRASIAQHSDSVCDAVALHAQAISATLVDEPYAADHYQQPLAKNSVGAISPPLAGIAEVIQPYTSYGGKPAEQDSIFYTRISERLRHKQRALSIWDYERLVLERFPQIYKVKCLSADACHKPDDVGKVSVIVIPDIRDQIPFEPFAPKAPANIIAEIEEFLQEKVPAYVNVEVKNAHYIPVKVRIGVRFNEGYDVGFYKARLIDDLNQFLSPWAYKGSADVVIGERIYANSIINYLDQRDYVDYVAGIKLFTIENGKPKLAMPHGEEGYYVSTDRADGVLVASRSHDIDLISETGYEQEQFVGINYMKIELDFLVG